MVDNATKAQISRDIYHALFEDTKRRLIASGRYTVEQADEQAFKEIKAQIWNTRPGQAW
jgi:hypothetical protein